MLIWESRCFIMAEQCCKSGRVFRVGPIGVAWGAKGAVAPKYLENIVILCFERRFSKQNSVIHLQSNIVPPLNFWAGYATSRAGFGLKFVTMFRADVGLAYKTYKNNIQSNDFFFRDVHLLCSPWSLLLEVIMTFLQLILLANTAAFFCSLL